MTIKKALERAKKRREDDKEYLKDKREAKSVDSYFLNELFERSGEFSNWENRILIKELAAYILDKKEGRAESNFIKHLEEYEPDVFEEE